ncbi:MAG: S1 RNA-binding domain-containing protein [Anaerolineae bacterium]|nr:S1 RNA-binding domain-containing protein [Anaerolineae bacterium]
MSNYKDNVYQINQMIVAHVEQIFPFGVFVRLSDGTQAFIRRRELTQAGNLDPDQIVSEGDEIKGLVIGLATPNQNLELSVRRAEPDPWDTFLRSYNVRDTITATVKNLSARGVYVQIVPGIDGFIPLAELAPWSVKQPKALFWVGDHVKAMITFLDKQKRRVKLSIRQQMKHEILVGQMLDSLGQREGIKGEGVKGDFERDDIAPHTVGSRDVDSSLVEKIGRVLVVDDHDEVREPLVAWLSRLGFAAEGAGSVEQALSYLYQRTYGVALIDLDLSGKDGLDFIKTLVQVAPNTKVAVMSIPEWIAQRSEELEALGISDIFAKPLNLEEIYESFILLRQGQISNFWKSTSKVKPKESPNVFQQLTGTMHSGLPLPLRFEAGLRELVRFTQAEQGLIFYLAPDSQQISIVVQVGHLPLDQEAIYALGESPVKDVICERGDIFEACVSQQAMRRFDKLLDLVVFESCLGVPISAGGEVHHALFLFHRTANAFARYRLRDARAMALLFSVALESQALEQRIEAVNPLLLSGQLAAGFSHEVYNKISGLEIQLRNLRADCASWQQGGSTDSFSVTELENTTDQLLKVTLDLKSTVELFRELMRTEYEEEVNVNEVVQRTVKLLRPTIHHYRVRVKTELTLDLPTVKGGIVRLQQIFTNLILNAIQQIARKTEQWPDGQRVLFITTNWETNKECPVRIRFTDVGPGIHSQLWESIFALGFSSRPGGTGLGLFIARSLVESMGGGIVVEESIIPMGTTFRVELPQSS